MRSILLALVAAASLCPIADVPAQGGAPQAVKNAAFEQTNLFTAGMDGYHTYHIPALLVTARGSVWNRPDLAGRSSKAIFSTP